MQEAFFKETAKVFRVTECSIAPRFQQDGKEMLWKIRAISQAENVEIWKKSGENPKRYESMVLAASVVFPDLKGADLQDSYGVKCAEELISAMLTPGEYTNYTEKLFDNCGFGDKLDLVEQAKN